MYGYKKRSVSTVFQTHTRNDCLVGESGMSSYSSAPIEPNLGVCEKVTGRSKRRISKKIERDKEGESVRQKRQVLNSSPTHRERK